MLSVLEVQIFQYGSLEEHIKVCVNNHYWSCNVEKWSRDYGN